MKKLALVLLVLILTACSSGAKLNETVELEDYSIKFNSSLFENTTDDDLANRLDLVNENVEFIGMSLDKDYNFFNSSTEKLSLEELIAKMLALYTDFDPEVDTAKESKIDGFDAYSFETKADYATIIVAGDRLIVALINTDLDSLPTKETKSLKESIKSIKINKQ